jgi:hypothetical protein
VVTSVMALVLFGRLRHSPVPRPGALSNHHAAARLAGGAALFVVATIVASYAAMVRQPVVAFFYGLAGTDTFGAWLQLALFRSPWLPGVQALRALIAVAALLLIVAGDRGPRHLTAALSGAVTAVLAGAPWLIPTPWLPETVRLSRVAEVIWTMLPLGALFAEILLLGQVTRPSTAEENDDGGPLLGLDGE